MGLTSFRTIHFFSLALMFPKGGRIAFRAAFAPGDELVVKKLVEKNGGVQLHMTSVIGSYTVDIDFPDLQHPLLHYHTLLKLNFPLLIPYWPRDIIFLGKEKMAKTFGTVKAFSLFLRSFPLMMRHIHRYMNRWKFFVRCTTI